MAKLAIPSGVGAVVKATQLLEAGLHHEQIRCDTAANTPYRVRLIEAQDLTKLLPWLEGCPGV